MMQSRVEREGVTPNPYAAFEIRTPVNREQMSGDLNA